MKLSEMTTPLDDALGWIYKHISIRDATRLKMIRQLRDMHADNNVNGLVNVDILELKVKNFPNGWVSPPFKVMAERIDLQGFDTKDLRFDWIHACDDLNIQDFEKGEVSDIRVDEIQKINGLLSLTVLADVNHCKRIVSIFDLVNLITVQLRVCKDRSNSLPYAAWIYNNSLSIGTDRFTFNTTFELQDLLIDNGLEDMA